MKRAYRRVLVVGNGVTLIPRMFCHAGFETVALDISAVATDFAREYQPTAEDWRLLFQRDEDGNIGNHRERFARQGGALEFVCGDLFDTDVAPGPFDLIWSVRSLQGFTDEDLASAIRALDRRLRPDGECHVLVQNSVEAKNQIVGEFEKLGYAVNPPRDHERGRVLRIGIGSG